MYDIMSIWVIIALRRAKSLAHLLNDSIGLFWKYCQPSFIVIGNELCIAQLSQHQYKQST